MDIQSLSRHKRDTQNQKNDTTTGSAQVPLPRRRWKTRILIPLIILLATLALIGYAARDLIRPATRVSVVRAIPVNAEQGNAGDAAKQVSSGPASVVAQAPGWVEPDPYPIFVTALADGIVDKIHVLEGETVKKGQVLVELVREDAQLALEQARAELQKREAILAAAETDLKEPVSLERAAAVSKAKLAEANASLIRLDAEIAKEEAKLAELDASYKRLTEISKAAVSALKVDEVKYQVQSQRAVVRATEQRRPELEAALNAAEAEYHAAKRDLALKTALIRNRDEAAAGVQAARTTVNEAELRLSRMTLKSPADGVVMARLTAPGDKLMLGMDDMHSAHAIHLYDPKALQVRVDVPLADAAAVGVGQRAKIIVDVLPDTEFNGVVTRVVHRADLAKNTVQFKVEIEDPSPLLKPEMLARVKFFSASGESVVGGNNTRAVGSTGVSSVVIQQSAIVKNGNERFVWWVSPEGQQLAKRTVKVGRERGEGMVMIHEGLNPGDVVVNNPAETLEEKQRVRIEGD